MLNIPPYVFGYMCIFLEEISNQIESNIFKENLKKLKTYPAGRNEKWRNCFEKWLGNSSKC